MSGWPLTKAWTAFFVLYGLSAVGNVSDLGSAGMLGALMMTFAVTWGLQSVVGWLKRKWAAFRGGGHGDDEGPEDAPDPAD